MKQKSRYTGMTVVVSIRKAVTFILDQNGVFLKLKFWAEPSIWLCICTPIRKTQPSLFYCNYHLTILCLYIDFHCWRTHLWNNTSNNGDNSQTLDYFQPINKCRILDFAFFFLKLYIKQSGKNFNKIKIEIPFK